MSTKLRQDHKQAAIQSELGQLAGHPISQMTKRRCGGIFVGGI